MMYKIYLKSGDFSDLGKSVLNFKIYC